MEKFTQEALDFLKDIIVIVVIVLIVRTFLVMPFQINGESMMDSYYDKQFILVDRLTHREIPVFGKLQDIDRGDVLVFKPGVDERRKYFIKRVIGLPGEEIKIQDGRIYIRTSNSENFIELEEGGYLNAENDKKTYVGRSNDEQEHRYQVPEGMYFVLGDNRNHSTDSRTCFKSCALRGEFVAQHELVGRVFLDLGYFSFSSFSFRHPHLDISTAPQFFSSLSHYSY